MVLIQLYVYKRRQGRGFDPRLDHLYVRLIDAHTNVWSRYMEVTPVILKEVLYDSSNRTFYCADEPLQPLEIGYKPMAFSTDIPIVSADDVYLVERPTYITGYPHSCIGHAYMDATMPVLSVLHEYSPEILSARGFQLFVLKDTFNQRTTDADLIEFLQTWESKTVDFENGCYKGPYAHFHKCLSDSPILFEKNFAAAGAKRYIKFHTMIFGGNHEFQRAIHNCSSKYPERKLVPVATDDQLRGWLSVAKEAFGKYLGVREKTPASAPRILYIVRKGTREFINADLRKLCCLLDVEPVFLEEHTMTEQVQMFIDADIVISAHGSGLLHSAWCSPGALIIELFATTNDCRRRIFESFTAVLGLNYRRIETSKYQGTTDAPVGIPDWAIEEIVGAIEAYSVSNVSS
jgi:Glycosyltransferase 61